MDYISELGMGIVVLTNGLDLDDEIINRFKKYNVLVRIPLLGIEKTDEKITSVPKLYNLVVNNIKKLANIGINLTVTTTVMKNNIGDISKIQEFADFLDLDFEKAPIF